MEEEELVMRNVSFVEHIEFEFKGNVIPQTMVLADVDNDSANELVVGNIYGEVAIFKGDALQPWKKISLSGMLTCLSVGSVIYPKKNNLVCLTAEGWCSVYDISSLSASQSTMSHEEGVEKAILTQELPANARVMCLADIDMDGHVEMVIGYSDRVVRAFRWHETHESVSGHFVLIQKWQLAGQIGNIAIDYSTQGHPELIASQPGATFVTLKVNPSFRHVKSESQICSKVANMRQGRSNLERSGSFAGEISSSSRRGSSSNNPYFSKLDSSAPSINMSGSRDFPGLTNTIVDNVSTHSEFSYRSLENINIKGGNKEVENSKNSNSISNQGTKSKRGKLQKSVSDADQPSTGSSSCKGSTNHIECSSEEDLVFKNLNTDQLPNMNRINADSCEKLGNPNANSFGFGKEELGNTNKLNPGKHLYELDVSFDSEDASIVYHPCASHTAQDENCSTIIVGAVRHKTTGDSQEGDGGYGQTYNAVATLDGSVVLLSKEDKIMWHLLVDHDVFALSKLDVTGDGSEELICCSWNGQTYIINHNKEIVGFHFTDSVVAFDAGYYSINESSNNACFVYATSSGRIYIYHNIMLSHLKSTNLLEAMSSKSQTAELLSKLDVKGQDLLSLQQLYHWCLYGKHGNS